MWGTNGWVGTLGRKRQEDDVDSGLILDYFKQYFLAKSLNSGLPLPSKLRDFCGNICNLSNLEMIQAKGKSQQITFSEPIVFCQMVHVMTPWEP